MNNKGINSLMKSYEYKKKKMPFYCKNNSKGSKINSISKSNNSKENNKINFYDSVNSSVNNLNNSKKKPIKIFTGINNNSKVFNSKSKKTMSNNKKFYFKNNKLKNIFFEKEIQRKKSLDNDRKNTFDNIERFCILGNDKENTKDKRHKSVIDISLFNKSNQTRCNTSKQSLRSKKKLRKKSLKLGSNISTIKSKYRYTEFLPKKDSAFPPCYSLLENLIRQTEKDFNNQKTVKTSSHKVLIGKVYHNLNNFIRNSKKLNKLAPLLHDFRRDGTRSIEHKKNIPHFYKNYINKTKTVYNSLNSTYSSLKSDITSDIIYNKRPESVKRIVAEKENDYSNKNARIREVKTDIGYKRPTVEFFTDTSLNFQLLTHTIENINHLNSIVAYNNRYYFGKKFGINIKKDLLKIQPENETKNTNEDQLFKFRKTLPHC